MLYMQQSTESSQQLCKADTGSGEDREARRSLRIRQWWLHLRDCQLSSGAQAAEPRPLWNSWAPRPACFWESDLPHPHPCTFKLSSGLLASFEFLQWRVQPLPQGLWTCCSLFPLFPVNTYSPFRVELNVAFLGCLFWPIRLSFVLLLPITVSLITGLVKMWIGLWTDALPLPNGQAGSRASLRHPCTCVVLKAGDQLIQQRWVSLPTG